MKTSELTGAALDWAVAIAEGFKPKQLYISRGSIYTRTFDDDGNPDGYTTGPDRLYSHKWEAGGPIIEREEISLMYVCNWEAIIDGSDDMHVEHGDTPLIAAMRCYVASKLGDEVEIPKELM